MKKETVTWKKTLNYQDKDTVLLSIVIQKIEHFSRQVSAVPIIFELDPSPKIDRCNPTGDNGCVVKSSTLEPQA